MGFNFMRLCDLRLFDRDFLVFRRPRPLDLLCRWRCLLLPELLLLLLLLLEESSKPDVESSVSMDESLDSELLLLDELLEDSLEELHLFFLFLRRFRSDGLEDLPDELSSLEHW